ncbi:MAG: ABC transporter permease subunit [Planctomycetota bacterium]|jgi:NitT/TauT family transport system permease protein|nr:ABC transporter permease subunit [Planctomycetota bacterium]
MTDGKNGKGGAEAGGLAWAVLIFAGLIAAYALVTDVLSLPNPMIFPGWRKIIPDAIKSWPLLLRGLVSSMGLLLPSVFGAIITGVGLGMSIGLRPGVKRALMPLLRAMNPIPSTMLIPYALAVMPTFWLSSAAIIYLGVLWPVLMNTLYGIAMLEPRWIDNARCLNLTGFRLVCKVVLPGAMPQIFSGINAGLIRSFLLLTVAEMFGAKAGLGFFVQYYADFAEYGRVIGGMLFLSAVVVAIMAIFDRIQGRVLHWTKKR